MREFRKSRLRELVAKAGGATAFVRDYSKDDADKPIDATYIRQILSGHRSFGEKAARKMEKRAGLATYYFDGSEVLNPLEAQLVGMYRGLPEDFKDALLADANKYLSLASPKSSAANPFNGTSPTSQKKDRIKFENLS